MHSHGNRVVALARHLPPLLRRSTKCVRLDIHSAEKKPAEATMAATSVAAAAAPSESPLKGHRPADKLGRRDAVAGAGGGVSAGSAAAEAVFYHARRASKAAAANRSTKAKSKRKNQLSERWPDAAVLRAFSAATEASESSRHFWRRSVSERAATSRFARTAFSACVAVAWAAALSSRTLAAAAPAS